MSQARTNCKMNSGLSDKSPSDTVENFYKHAIEGEYSKMNTFLPN
nr:hypothetical protein [Paenibacillus bovis]